MSTLAAVKHYDHIFDAQKHYRILLQATARPGTIGQLDDAALDIPSQYKRATALLALTLFSGDCTYFSDFASPDGCGFLNRETLARPADAAHADFLILANAHSVEALRQARLGSLQFPEFGATVIAQVEAISPAPIHGALRLKLTGPGIETTAEVYILGASPEYFSALRERNSEFPMGVDAFFTCDSLSAGPCVLALPRTTRVECEQI